MPERKGMIMNHIEARHTNDPGFVWKDIALDRLFKEEKLGVRRRRGRKRIRARARARPEARTPAERWSLDVLSDTFAASVARPWFARQTMRGAPLPHPGG